jgi:NAD(P)-dependent dehydrogenase (short-subunit alcohol dehydrogenase family)
MAGSGFDNPVSATVRGILHAVRGPGEAARQLREDDRFDGKTVLVTGANSGLGKAVAIEVARRGGRVVMACRSGIPEAGEEVRRASGSRDVEMVRVDLSDFDSTHRYLDDLRDRGVRFDTVVFNAGMMPRDSRPTKHGLDVMASVNYLAVFIQATRMLRDGVIPNATFGGAHHTPTPRIVIVASETHREPKEIEFDHLGTRAKYGMRDGMHWYGHSKLLLVTLAQELARRLESDGSNDVAVHTLCPGPVNSNMAREAPGWVKPVLGLVMKAFFASPEAAALPVVLLAGGSKLEGRTGCYFHTWTQKEPSPIALDPQQGARLWEVTESLLRAHGGLR